MSRIGKKPIPIPQGVQVLLEGDFVVVKGPLGELKRKIPEEIGVEIKEGKIIVTPKKETKKTNALWGLTRALLFNMVTGVDKGYEKILEIQGVGYRANLEDEDLLLNIGFSHPVRIKKPEGIKFSVEKNIISVFGTDKELVGQVAAKIRKIRPPEPYKGKGIRYLGEVVRIKPGKKAVGAEQ